jgi:hypothetical protein
MPVCRVSFYVISIVRVSTNWPTVPIGLALSLQVITMVHIQNVYHIPTPFKFVPLSKLYVSYSNDLSHYCKSYVMKSPSPILHLALTLTTIVGRCLVRILTLWHHRGC